MSTQNNDTVIISDEDTDGMCAARIIHNAVTLAHPKATHSILWQKWDFFGVKDEDLTEILEREPSTVFILDLGSGLDMLAHAVTLLSKGISTIILDNHPPDSIVETPEDYKKYQTLLTDLREKFPLSLSGSNPFFFYDSSTSTCSTGIAYNFARGHGWSVANMEKWALLGLEGDVAHDEKNSPEGFKLYRELITKHGSGRGLLASKAMHSNYDWSMLGFYAQLLHNPRRMIFNKAPPVVYEAMKEMELIPNWLDLYAMVNKEELLMPVLKTNPSTKILLDLTLKYRDGKGEVEKRGNYTQLDYGDYGVTIITHKWNIGSALSSKLSNTNHKSWFVINDIPDYGIHVSGRGGDDGKLHIGKVFRCADPTIMEGGGLKPAGSARTHTKNVELVLDELVRAVEVSKK